MKECSVDGVVITHPERVVYPDDDITKRDVAGYYAAVMDWFLAGVSDRPTSVLRYPEGIGEKGFFQKHPIRGLQHTGKVRLREESGELDDYICPRSAASVIELVQWGAIEFHPWAARADALEEVDYLVFDLDPAPDLIWKDVVEAARLVRGRLAELSLQSFVRTTGGKGLHVVVPLHSSCHWETARQFARGFARRLEAEQPHSFIAHASRSQREGKIFIDYLRNSRGATSVASYSLRARTGATVAMPLRWTELGKCHGALDFTLRTVRRRLAGLLGSPWDGFDSLRQRLPEAAFAEDA